MPLVAHLARLEIWDSNEGTDFGSAGEFIAMIATRRPNVSDISFSSHITSPSPLFSFPVLTNLHLLAVRKLKFQQLMDPGTSSESSVPKSAVCLWPGLEELTLTLDTTCFELCELLKVSA